MDVAVEQVRKVLAQSCYSVFMYVLVACYRELLEIWVASQHNLTCNCSRDQLNTFQ